MGVSGYCHEDPIVLWRPGTSTGIARLLLTNVSAVQGKRPSRERKYDRIWILKIILVSLVTFRVGFFMEAVLGQVYFSFPWMTLMIGVVLLIQMSMACHRGFYHLRINSHTLMYFGSLLHINCQQSYWFLHDLVECPEWGLVERFFDSADFCVPLHSVIVITTISPSKFVSYLCPKRAAEQKSLPARALGVPLPAARESSGCLSVSCRALLLAPERCQSLLYRVLPLWNMWASLTSHTCLSQAPEVVEVLMGEGQRMCSAKFVLEKIA